MDFLKKRLVKTCFFTPKIPMGKMDKSEKIGILSVTAVCRYVNLTAAKKWKFPLWKNLWRMWKTLTYQQITRFSPQAVEKPKPIKKVEIR